MYNGPSQLVSGAHPYGVVEDILLSAGGVGGEQTPEEGQLVKTIYSLFTKAKKHKETWSKDHVRFWNLWESNHYKGKIPHTLTQAVVNQIWSSVETFVGHVADSLPEPLARARTPDQRERAKLVSKWLRYVADTVNLEQKVQHPTRSACVTGLGWLSVDWDDSLLHGRGDVAVEPVDDRFIYPAPHAKTLDEAGYVIEAKNMPREWVVGNYEKGYLVPPGARDPSLFNERTYSGDNRHDAAAPNHAMFTTTTGSESRWTSSSGVAGPTTKDLVTVHKAYIRQEDGSMNLLVVANGVLLQNGPSPYDDDEYPYVPFNILPTLDTLNGRGIVQFIEGLQEILNASISMLLDQQRFVADPMLVVSGVNLEDGQLVDNQPGAILPDNDPHRVGYGWLSAPGFHQGFLQIQELVTGYMDSVLGRVDVLKGERPAGVTTLGGMEIIREQANVRMRSLIRWIRASIKRTYRLILSRLRQFASDERTLRVIGKLGQEEFVTVNPVVGADISGQPKRDITIPEDVEFDVEFSKDTEGGRQTRKEDAIQLANTPSSDGMPMVDRQYVLEQFQVEEAPEIAERMEQAAAEASEAQSQMAAEQRGEPPAPEPEQELEQAMKYLMGGA